MEFSLPPVNTESDLAAWQARRGSNTFFLPFSLHFESGSKSWSVDFGVGFLKFPVF